MTIFADLSPYTYSEDDIPMVNVGWLGRGIPFPHGVVDAIRREKLLWLADDPQNRMRGWHDCEFCDTESPIEFLHPEAHNGEILLGNGEIHVPDGGGVVYAAPTLVVHYIAEHRYLPPQQFLEALDRMPDPRPMGHRVASVDGNRP